MVLQKPEARSPPSIGTLFEAIHGLVQKKNVFSLEHVPDVFALEQVAWDADELPLECNNASEILVISLVRLFLIDCGPYLRSFPVDMAVLSFKK